jgi:CopG family nickel-responsive transcriptional regulator
MSQLCRIGVAIDADLLQRFDQLIAQRGYANRSEAFRDLIRRDLVEETGARPDAAVVGVVTLVYDHHTRQLSDKLTEQQHKALHHVHTTLHVHLDHDHCLEVLVLRGNAREVKSLAESLIATKGVKHGRLALTVEGGPL